MRRATGCRKKCGGGGRAFAASYLQRRVGFDAMSTEFMLDPVEGGLSISLLPDGCLPTN